jgi:E3 ubiquitin-protein ligase RAD18
MKSLISISNEEVSDPSDWNETKFPNFGDFDSYLRCQICKEFLKAPVLTTCGHVFCSICIRRTISETNKCPVCLDETYESSLRKVLLLDNIINWYTINRSALIQNLQIDHVIDSQDDEQSDINSEIEEIISSDPSSIDMISSIDSKRNPKQTSENLAECPVCEKFMTLDELQNSHIDECLKNSNKSDKFSRHSKTLEGFFNASHFSDKNDITNTNNNNNHNQKNSIKNIQLQSRFFKNKQRLPNLDTSLSTAKLKEKMNLLNIPINGTRTQLEHRMKEFINLYNANLDSINPVNDLILVDRLKKWESLIYNKTLNSNNNNRTNSPPINYDEQTIKRQKIDHVSWNNKNKNHYAELIKIARNNMHKQKSKEKLQKEEEGEEEGEEEEGKDSNNIH